MEARVVRNHEGAGSTPADSTEISNLRPLTEGEHTGNVVGSRGLVAQIRLISGLRQVRSLRLPLITSWQNTGGSKQF